VAIKPHPQCSMASKENVAMAQNGEKWQTAMATKVSKMA
jgi:hypothetical protein